MSRIKDYYIDEIMNAQRWVSEVSFSCPEPGRKAEILEEVDVPEPNYAAEKTSDMTSEGTVEIECQACGTVHLGYAWAGPAHCDITLSEYPDTRVRCEAPGYDRPPEDWYDETEIPDDPLSVFKLNRDELDALIEKLAHDDGSSLMNRMIFAQILTFLEAFLCDTLITGLREHPDRLANFAAKDGPIAQIDIRATDVLSDAEHVRKLIEYNLKSRLYHQFGSGKKGKHGKSKAEGVVLWYATAFGFELTPSEDDLVALRDYAKIRHDCVHRNGVTKDDVALTVFDKTFLKEALTRADQIVDHIAAKLDELNGNSEKELPF